MRQVRTTGAAAALLAATVTVIAAAGAPAAPPIEPKVGRFNITMHSSINLIPKTLQLMDYWYPVPIDGPHQKVSHLVFSGPYTADMAVLPDQVGGVAYMRGAPRGGLPLQARVTFDVETTETLTAFNAAPDKTPPDDVKKLKDRWLKPETMVAVDKDVRSIANKIVAGKKKPLDRARALYDRLVTGVARVSPYELRGVGYGNVKFTLSQMKGDDNDIASAFVGLCRAVGIPARSVIGLLVPAGRKEGPIADFHSWAEFWLDGVGWVPVDPAEGRSTPSRREYCFGGLDERHVALSYGRDVTLVPAQAGPPLNYWVKPYWEGDQKPMPDPAVDMAFTEQSGTPEAPPEPAMPTEKPAPSKPPR